MSVCPNCGTTLTENAKFCIQCGTKIPEQLPESQCTPAPAEEEPAQEQNLSSACIEAADAQPVYAQPVYAQPVYAQPVYTKPKKKKKTWIVFLVLGLAAVLILSAIGGIALFKSLVAELDSDPNLGTYVATEAQMWNMQMDVNDVFDGGLTIELRENGSCTIYVGGTSGEGVWTLDNGILTVDDGNTPITGTLENGTMYLEDVLGLGLNITLVQQQTE